MPALSLVVRAVCFGLDGRKKVQAQANRADDAAAWTAMVVIIAVPPVVGAGTRSVRVPEVGATELRAIRSAGATPGPRNSRSPVHAVLAQRGRPGGPSLFPGEHGHSRARMLSRMAKQRGRSRGGLLRRDGRWISGARRLRRRGTAHRKAAAGLLCLPRWRRANEDARPALHDGTPNATRPAATRRPSGEATSPQATAPHHDFAASLGTSRTG